MMRETGVVRQMKHWGITLGLWGSDFWDCHGCANAECRTANGEGKGKGLSWVGLEVRVTGSWDAEVSGGCMAHDVRLCGTCWTAVI